jgi:predicted acyl esterase
MVPCLAARTFAASSGTRLPSQVLPGLFIGANAGPRDQRAVESRHDVLCYTSEPLAEPVEVIGPVLAVLHVSSSAPDTDFTAKLVDVAPGGRRTWPTASCAPGTASRCPSRLCLSRSGCTR